MRKILVAFLYCISCIAGYTQELNLMDSGKSISLMILAPEQDPLPCVVNMWQEDMKTVFGALPEVSKVSLKGKKPLITIDKTLSERTHIILAVAGEASVDEWLHRHCLETISLSGKWEYFRLQIIEVKGHRHLLVLGSDALGAAYGLLELSRLAGVSPWVWWADVQPEKKDYFSLPEDFYMQDGPSVRFRGIFINDEDFALMPWVTKTLVPNSPKGQLGPEFYSKVFQLLLRLKANLLWPAMHECSSAFYAVEGNLEAAKRYGIYIGTSHCEPLMRNNVAEWNASERGDYDYAGNADNVKRYWQERLDEVKNSPCVYTLGMRGIHDGKMQGAKTLQEQTDLSQRVIDDQREMLATTLQDSVQQIPQVFIPYKEVLDIYRNGLRIPQDVTLIWCDDNYGYIRQLSSPEEQSRSGGAGVYYHVSYWGRPHDYLWLASTAPALIHTEMRRAWDEGAQQLWVLNVGDIKPAEYLTEFFLDLAWHIDMIDLSQGEAFTHHLNRFYTSAFGTEYAAEITDIMRRYYHLAYQRKPEFTAWSRVEESKQLYSRGWTPIADSDWSESEISERLQQYQDIESAAERIADVLDESKYDSYYQLVLYPVCGASLINQKNLYAELSRKDFVSGRYALARDEADKALSAYQVIQEMTAYYNENMSQGKWQGMMNSTPRGLYVFGEPLLPKGWDTTVVNANERLMAATVPADTIAVILPAMDALSVEGIQVIPDLGYSGHLLRLKKGQCVEYEFERPFACDTIEVSICTAPNHAADGGDLRYEVVMDDAPALSCNYRVVGRSEVWKQQVLSNQAVFTFRQPISRSGKHRIKITAMDDDIRLDRIILK